MSPSGARITRSEKLLLLVLADYHEERSNEAWPSVKALAEDTMLSPQRVKELRQSLVSKGVIETRATFQEDGRNGPNHYSFSQLATRREVAPSSREPVPPLVETSTGSSRAAYGVPVEQPTPSLQLAVNQPSKEPPQGPPPYTMPVRSGCYRAFQDYLGRPVTPVESELLKALEEEHPKERILYAIEAGAMANVRSMAYVKKVCENQESSGDDRDAGKPGATPVLSRPQNTDGQYRAELARYGIKPVERV